MKKYPEALEDVNRAIALYPQAEDNYLLRSKILFDMGRFADGISNLWMASEIWPHEDSVQEWVRGAAIHLVYEGHELFKDSAAKPPGRLGTPGSPFFGSRLGRLQADQVQIAAVEQFPLDGFASLHSDGGSQRDGE
ncbi:MAG: hypothetical protein EXQ58_08795, partial [Acidobacteria bacterium]|nr:hypothetical protein [Acidobacteriota bacterium]